MDQRASHLDSDLSCRNLFVDSQKLTKKLW
uniref:Uncharacterized protein n=1 Tax=Rhizophora mucronata TaxID=61149 RepID=A0A2P2PYS0_RHIMU